MGKKMRNNRKGIEETELRYWRSVFIRKQSTTLNKVVQFFDNFLFVYSSQHNSKITYFHCVAFGYLEICFYMYWAQCMREKKCVQKNNMSTIFEMRGEWSESEFGERKGTLKWLWKCRGETWWTRIELVDRISKGSTKRKNEGVRS